MASSFSCAKLSTLTIGAVLLQMLGLLLFVLGFFPVKPALSGVSGPESDRAPTCHSAEDHEVIPQLPPDQLKSSYVFRLLMDFQQSLCWERISAYKQDYDGSCVIHSITFIIWKSNWIPCESCTSHSYNASLEGQFYNIGWKMVMLGDETWVKLFPGLFTRHDGISSFFVKDTIEVDYNVSRHLEAELLSDDWNLLDPFLTEAILLDSSLPRLGSCWTYLWPQQ